MLMNALEQTKCPSAEGKYINFYKVRLRDSILAKLTILKLANTSIEIVSSIKFIGMVIDQNFDWIKHPEFVENKISRKY